ncbi:homing endonuclease [Bacillus phage vB_BceH_LY2]|nr:homing endonuclease [Bacillus phage vB_BceH_LY2]
MCNPQKIRTTHYFKNKVKELVGTEYTVESEYIGHHKKLEMKHVKCGTVYKVAPSDFIKGRRCKKCYVKSRYKTNAEWLRQVNDLTGYDYEFLEEYKGDSIKLRYKHVCGGVHSVTPNNFINGTRCTICKESIGEANVRLYLERKGINFKTQHSFEGLVSTKKLSYDFFLPDMDILIEFQGVQHYEPVEFFGGQTSFDKQVAHDKLKRDFAKDNHYLLIEIKYTNDTIDKITNLLDNTMSSKNIAM